MIHVSTEFKQCLNKDRRNFLYYADVTLKDGTTFNFTRDQIWSGTFKIEDSVSQDNNFDIGDAIVNKASFTINNIDEGYSEYDFTDATVVMSIGLQLSDSIEKIKKFTGTADETKYNGSLIALSFLDNMSKFDKDFDTNDITFPATIDEIIHYCCTKCGVLLGATDFPNKKFRIESLPSEQTETLTYRQMIAYCAQICGCFARCNANGALELKWYDEEALNNEFKNNTDGGTYDTKTTPYSDGASLNGGTFDTTTTPYSDGDTFDANTNSGGAFDNMGSVHYFVSSSSHEIGTDDVVITGVKVSAKGGTEEKAKSYLKGSTGYVISIENNPLITEDNLQTIGDYLGNRLIGFTFRTLSASALPDPSVEAGDVGFYFDRKGRRYPIVVSSVTFTAGNYQQIKSSAATPARNSATRYSQETKNYVELRKQIEKEKSTRDLQLEALRNALSSSSGLYTTVEKADSGQIYYFHNKKALNDSDIIWKMTSEAWGVSTDGGKTWNAGMTVDGDTITRILTATGINAEWIKTGTISDKYKKNFWNMDTGEFQLQSGTKIGDSEAATKEDISNIQKSTIKSVDIEYASSTSNNLSPENGWQTDAPAWSEGHYIWQRTKTTMADGSSTYSSALCITGVKGDSGKGIESTEVAYCTSSDGAKEPVSGWQGHIPTLNQGEYLWTRTTVTYTDQTTSTAYSVSRQGNDGSSPTATVTKSDGVTTITITDKNGEHTQTITDGENGTPGKDGENGKTSYLHVKYSDDAGKTFTENNGETAGKYIGVYSNQTENDSNAVADYTWVKIEGDDGIPSYVHFAYATSADGKDSFSTEWFAGASYLGARTDHTAKDSEAYTDYEWSLIKGKDGKDGTSVTILGSYDTIEDLKTAHATGDTGDGYMVGGNLYVWSADDSAWKNVGQIKGEDGKDGTSSYVHFAYATSSDGLQGFNTSWFAEATYMGVLADHKEQDSDVYTDYKWSLIRGRDGHTPIVKATKNGTETTITIDGQEAAVIKDGTNGESIKGDSAYLHIAYAKSSDGQDGFSTTWFNTATYIGFKSDHTEKDSDEYTDYEWSRIKGNDGKDGTTPTVSATKTGTTTTIAVNGQIQATIEDGEKGDTGTGVSEIVEEYYLSTSNINQTGGTWSTSSPTWSEGHYIWTRSKVTWTDKTVTTTTPVLAEAVNSANETASSAKDTADTANKAVTNLDNSLTQQEIFNRLTNNGETQGIYLKDGKLYVNGSYIATGIITDKTGKNKWNLDTGELSITATSTATEGEGRAWVGAGEPSSSASPVKDWTEKDYESHTGDTYYDIKNNKTYRFKKTTVEKEHKETVTVNEWLELGLNINLEGQLMSKPAAYVEVYYLKDGKYYYVTDLQGTWLTNKGSYSWPRTVHVPVADNIYLHLVTGKNEYDRTGGFEVTSAKKVTDDPDNPYSSGYQTSRLPTVNHTYTYSGTNYPKASNPPDNTSDMYVYNSGITLGTASAQKTVKEQTIDYGWEEGEDTSTKSDLATTKSDLETAKGDITNTKSDLSALEGKAVTSIGISGNNIKAYTSDGKAASTVDMTSSNIVLATMDSSGNVSSISADGKNISLKSDSISLTGYVKFSDLKSNSSTSINGDYIDTGSVSADHITLYGFMPVYESKTSGTYGGYIGYKEGSTGTETTQGIGIARGGSWFGEPHVMVTNAGAILSYESLMKNSHFLAVNGNCNCECNNFNITGNLYVSGSSKTRCVKTRDFGVRKMQAYETPMPMFADYGESQIAEDGKCYIDIDAVFAQTVKHKHYHVFLTKYGKGDLWVSKRDPAYFIVEGTPGLNFSWSIVAIQYDHDDRLQEFVDMDIDDNTSTDNYAKASIDGVNNNTQKMEQNELTNIVNCQSTEENSDLEELTTVLNNNGGISE